MEGQRPGGEGARLQSRASRTRTAEVADDHGDPEALLADLARAEAETAAYRDLKLKAILAGRGAGAMNAERLLAHYDRIADAARCVLARLRRFILAFWPCAGKLMPQDPSDEPASELMKRIEERTKARLVKGGRDQRTQAALFGSIVTPCLFIARVPLGLGAFD